MIVNSSGVDWSVGGVMEGCRYIVGGGGVLDVPYNTPTGYPANKTASSDGFI